MLQAVKPFSWKGIGSKNKMATEIKLCSSLRFFHLGKNLKSNYSLDLQPGEMKMKYIFSWDSTISFSSTIADGNLYTSSRGKMYKSVLLQQIDFSLLPPVQV